MTEKDHQQLPKVIELGPNGFGNPDAGISFEKKSKLFIEKYGEALYENVKNKGQELITNGEAFVDITRKDDGCMDGRTIKGRIKSFINHVKEIIPLKSKQERAKLAGGGLVSTQMMLLGVEERGRVAHEDLYKGGARLASKNIVCAGHGAGGHSGTGCAANDGEEVVIGTAVNPLYSELVAGKTAEMMTHMDIEFQPADYQDGLEKWEDATKDPVYFKESSGEDRLEAAMTIEDEVNAMSAEGEEVAVIVELEGEHNEWWKVYNTVKNKTFSQRKFRETMEEEFIKLGVAPEDIPQVFVVDLWRIKELADAASPEKKVEALQMGIAYQNAADATITDGSLPTYMYGLAA